MRAQTFLGQVIAVISRRTIPFTPFPNEASTFPGQVCAVIRHDDPEDLPRWARRRLHKAQMQSAERLHELKMANAQHIYQLEMQSAQHMHRAEMESAQRKHEIETARLRAEFEAKRLTVEDERLRLEAERRRLEDELAWFRRRFEGEFAEPQREREVSMAEAQPKTGATSTNLGSEPESPTVPTAASESTRTEEGEPLLTAGEVATMFRIDPKAVTRWVKSGKLTPIRTLGGHRRYREAEVRELLKGTPPERSE